MSPERIAAHLSQASDELDRLADWLTVAGHEAAAVLAIVARDLYDLKLAIEREQIRTWRAVPA
jgi:hypothetical protein